MRARRQRRWMGLAAGVIGLLVGLHFAHGQAPRPDDEAVRDGVREFAAHLGQGQIKDCGRFLAPQFTWGSYKRPDVIRGLVGMVRGYQDFNVVLGPIQVAVQPDGRHAHAQMQVSLLGSKNGAQVSAGEDRPLFVRIDCEKLGGRWQAIHGEGDGREASFAQDGF